MKKIFFLLMVLIVLFSCPKKEIEPAPTKIIGCTTPCPSGYECDESEGKCITLPHSFSCINSCPSDKYCSASGDCKPNPIFCQMGQNPTRCNSNTDCYAGQSCIDSYCFYPPCKCNSNADCDAINQICNAGVCDCYDTGCKSSSDCPEDHICVRNYPLCGQCVLKTR
ncbi:MAG: hypothetical protein ACP5QK_12815 [Myxococcota bacterium]